MDFWDGLIGQGIANLIIIVLVKGADLRIVGNRHFDSIWLLLHLFHYLWGWFVLYSRHRLVVLMIRVEDLWFMTPNLLIFIGAHVVAL